MLAYNETSIPGTTLSERLSLAMAENLPLEVANTGNCQVELYRGFKVVTLQAYRMHEFYPLHPEVAIRQEAFCHIQETLELAASLNAPRILTVCGFGYDIVDSPFECCLDFFDSLVPRAKSLGVSIMIEPLSPLRAGAFTEPKDVANLMEMLNEPSVFGMAIDTGHLLDSGVKLDDFFNNWQYPIAELQLKGERSTPPDPAMPVTDWLKNLPQIPSVICVEHRQPISLPKFIQLINVFR